MIVRNRHKLILSALAILILVIVLFVWLIAPNPVRRQSAGYVLLVSRVLCSTLKKVPFPQRIL
jgi:type II secretory pathway component PulM